MFVCHDTSYVWVKSLLWIQVNHISKPQGEELIWLSNSTKDKGRKASILKLAATKTTYGVWSDVCYYNVLDNNKIVDNKNIYDCLYEWCNRKLRTHIAKLMIFFNFIFVFLLSHQSAGSVRLLYTLKHKLIHS